MSKDFLWTEKYRPKTIAETLLPEELKQTLQSVVDQGEIPNMIFSGPPGTGKTTAAKAICNQLGLDYIVINGSEEGNIDTLRGKIKQFATTVSLTEGLHKVVILDEADYLNAQSTQPALRAFIEQYANNCRFIMTCNYKNRIIEPLHSRCSVFEFGLSKKQQQLIAGEMYKRLKTILNKEGTAYKDEDVIELIMKYAPDWRRTIQEAQRSSTTNNTLTLRAGSSLSASFKELFHALRGKDFKAMRNWVANNPDIDASQLFSTLYKSTDLFQPASMPQIVVILAEYQYKHAFVADHELNIVACLTEIMGSAEFK
jgi:DNA polymerase III delta prime subunit